MIKANNPSLKTWLDVPDNSDFPIQNIPFGVFDLLGTPTIATRIGNTIINLKALESLGFFSHIIHPQKNVFMDKTLNRFIALPIGVRRAYRDRISQVFVLQNNELQAKSEWKKLVLFPAKEQKMLLPVDIGDYTDFYSSMQHATNVGKMFRDPENALLPNWKHIPVGYHGRSSSIVVSGTNIHRPMGQTKADNADAPTFGPSQLVDFELEMAFVTSKKTKLGQPIPVNEAEDAIFGMVIFNDLSARDIQKWEYVPLGPFLSKSFGSVISPWIVTLDALEPFRTDMCQQEPEVLPYLMQKNRTTFNIELEVDLVTPENASKTICRSNFRNMYWSMAQQLAHQTVNGCNINPGDMYASGTISGTQPNSYGSMLELTWRGSKPIEMPDATQRRFVNDNDTIVMRAFAKNDKIRIGFGESVTTILPAKV